jgi:hypothetical protein
MIGQVRYKDFQFIRLGLAMGGIDMKRDDNERGDG